MTLSFSILLYAAKWNAAQETSTGKWHMLDAWRQVTEVLLCGQNDNDFLLAADARRQLLLDLLQALFNKVLAEGATAELANQVSGAVLLLLAALRQTYTSAKATSRVDIQFVSLLDANGGDASQRRGASTLYSTSLQVILKGLILWITNTSKRN